MAIGNRRQVKDIMAELPGKWVLVVGNHDKQHSPDWWMSNGFSFACQGMKYRNCWLTHQPSTSLADGCELNIHGHLHNIWHGFTPNGGLEEGAKKLKHPWQRLFAIEYTDYKPVVFEKFVTKPDKYLARGLLTQEG